MVIMDRQDYINKSNQLLSQPAYRSIPRDPTNKIKTKLINILQRVKNQTGLDNNTHRPMYPTGCRAPKFYGLCKIHKQDTPLRPIVSSCGSVTYSVAKELSKILKPLVGKSSHHINSIQDFRTGQKCNIITWGMPQLLWCFSAVHLSSSRSNPKYYQGPTGKRPHPQGKNSNVSRGHSSVIRIQPPKHLPFLPGSVLWTGWGCAAMGSPVSPIVANFYREYFEHKALSTASPLGSGTGMWMILLPYKRKKINKTSYNT